MKSKRSEPCQIIVFKDRKDIENSPRFSQKEKYFCFTDGSYWIYFLYSKRNLNNPEQFGFSNDKENAFVQSIFYAFISDLVGWILRTDKNRCFNDSFLGFEELFIWHIIWILSMKTLGSTIKNVTQWKLFQLINNHQTRIRLHLIKGFLILRCRLIFNYFQE